MALSFNEIASKKIDEVERPPLPPVGTYRWQITKLPATAKSNDGKWEILTFQVRAVEAVDVDDFDSYKGEVSGIQNSIRFMFNTEDEAEFEKTLYRVKTFLEKHVQCAEPGMSVAESINASVNQQFLGTISWTQDKNDPEVYHANINKTAPIS